MGLDVGLVRCDDFAKDQFHEDERYRLEEEFVEKELGGKWPHEYPEGVEHNAARTRLDARRFELDQQFPSLIERIEFDSAKYPEHMFKIGYLRSSYNEGGINSVLERVGLGNLYTIFFNDDKSPDEYYVVVDWNAARERCASLLEELRELDKQPRYDVLSESTNPFIDNGRWPDIDDAGALAMAREVLSDTERMMRFGSGFSNRDGHFFGAEGLKVRAIIPGSTHLLGTRPAVHVIYEVEEGYKWYIESLEITLEMIDWVLAQDNAGTYRLSWSG